MANWTQPVCDACYIMVLPGPKPHRLVDAQDETCCYCGKVTSSGIYMRVNPAHVPHPTLEG